MAREISIGIIGGSGVDSNNIFTPVKSIQVKTPFGDPSDVISKGVVEGVTVFYIPRHGKKHSLSPTNVNYRANIWALKQLGCTHVIGTTATGSLQDYVRPGDLLILSTYINRTTRRQSSYFNGDPYVGYVPMQPSFCEKLGEILLKVAKSEAYSCYPRGTVVTVEGPRFPSLAESALYHSWGADVLNMTSVPEVCLAKELAILYACIASVTDYCHWRVHPRQLKVETIVKVFETNSLHVETIIKKTIPLIAKENWDKDINLLEKIVERSKFKEHRQPPGALANHHQPTKSLVYLQVMNDGQQANTHYFKPENANSKTREIYSPRTVGDVQKLAMVDGNHPRAGKCSMHTHGGDSHQPFTISRSAAAPMAISKSVPDPFSQGSATRHTGQQQCMCHNHHCASCSNDQNIHQPFINVNGTLKAITIPPTSCLTMCPCPKICMCSTKLLCHKNCTCLASCTCPNTCAFSSGLAVIHPPINLQHAPICNEQNIINSHNSPSAQPPSNSGRITFLAHSHKNPHIEEYRTTKVPDIFQLSPANLSEISPAAFRHCTHNPLCPTGTCAGNVANSSDSSSSHPMLSTSPVNIKSVSLMNPSQPPSIRCQTLFHADQSFGSGCDNTYQTLQSTESPGNAPPSSITSKTLIYNKPSGIRYENVFQSTYSDMAPEYRPSSQMSCKTFCKTDPESGTRCNTECYSQAHDTPAESSPSSVSNCKTICPTNSSSVTRCETVCNDRLSLGLREIGGHQSNIPYERKAVSGYPRKILNYPEVNHQE